MCTRRSFRVSRKKHFLLFSVGSVYSQQQWTQEKGSKGDAVVFMALMFLCRFLLFGMSELMWIILNTG
jgi:hypothetical protein